MEDKDFNKFQIQAIVGRNAVLEALNSNIDIDTIYILKGDKIGSINKIVAMAKQKNIVIKDTNTSKLESLSQGSAHQGVAAILCTVQYYTVDDLLQTARQKDEQPFIIIADEIEDTHNLGAIIRTAEAAGAHGMIIPKRRAATLTPIIQKTSAGAVNHLKVARVTNLAAEIDNLKKLGFWVYGADMTGEVWCEVDYSGPVALIIGSEAKGIGRLIKSKCDKIVAIPMYGKINSLNASVAGGILMYEISRQRANIKAKNL